MMMGAKSAETVEAVKSRGQEKAEENEMSVIKAEGKTKDQVGLKCMSGLCVKQYTSHVNFSRVCPHS